MRDGSPTRCTTLNMHFTKSAVGRRSQEEKSREGKGEKWRQNKCGDLFGGPLTRRGRQVFAEGSEGSGGSGSARLQNKKSAR